MAHWPFRESAPVRLTAAPGCAGRLQVTVATMSLLLSPKPLLPALRVAPLSKWSIHWVFLEVQNVAFGK